MFCYSFELISLRGIKKRNKTIEWSCFLHTLSSTYGHQPGGKILICSSLLHTKVVS